MFISAETQLNSEKEKTTIMSAVDSFQVRVKNAVKGNYQTSMRRSLQSVALYEADRCLKYRYSQLRPFQKKYALYATAIDLLSTLDFLNEYHRQEIMFRTNASKEPLAPDLAWRRMKLITREINQTILPKAKEVMENDDNQEYKTHEKICDLILQKMYEESNDKNSTKPYPPMWEFNHNNVFTVYRIYFRGLALDPQIFPPKLHRMAPVPLKKPDAFRLVNGDSHSIHFGGMTINGRSRISTEMSEDERRAMLKEVKDHTELLKQFEGVIPDEELAKRKRALYAALPPVPPPLGGAAGGAGGERKRKKKSKAAPVAVPTIPTIPEMPKPVAAATPEEESKPMAMEEEEDWEKVVAESKDSDEVPEKVVTAV